MNAWQKLANEIVYQAVIDYRKSLRGMRADPRKGCCEMKHECEKFFRSEYFKILTPLDGELLITNLRKEYADECKLNSRNTQIHKKNSRHS